MVQSLNCKGKVSWSQCCVALLCFMVVGVNGKISYSYVESGACGSVTGQVGITGKATCQTAARDLGMSIYYTRSNQRPPGCSRVSEYTPPRVYYNSKSNSKKSCSSSNSCLCLIALECTQINGNEPNSASCTCGTKGWSYSNSNEWKWISGNGCSAAGALTNDNHKSAGSYCDASISLCSDVSSCSEQDGLTANNAACQCGSSKCSTDSGFYCTKSTSTCGF